MPLEDQSERFLHPFHLKDRNDGSLQFQRADSGDRAWSRGQGRRASGQRLETVVVVSAATQVLIDKPAASAAIAMSGQDAFGVPDVDHDRGSVTQRTQLGDDDALRASIETARRFGVDPEVAEALRALRFRLPEVIRTVDGQHLAFREVEREMKTVVRDPKQWVFHGETLAFALVGPPAKILHIRSNRRPVDAISAHRRVWIQSPTEGDTSDAVPFAWNQFCDGGGTRAPGRRRALGYAGWAPPRASQQRFALRAKDRLSMVVRMDPPRARGQRIRAPWDDERAARVPTSRRRFLLPIQGTRGRAGAFSCREGLSAKAADDYHRPG